MATKAIYSRWTGSAWEEFYFVTSSDVVYDVPASNHRFVTDNHLSQIGTYLGANTGTGNFQKTGQVGASYASKLVLSNGTGYIDKTQLDSNVSDVYMPKSGGTFVGNVTMQSGTINKIVLGTKGTPPSTTDSNEIEFLAHQNPSTPRTAKLWLKNDGVFQMDAGLNFNSQKITGLAEPTAGTDAATKNYVDVKSTYGALPVDAVVAASTGNLTLSGTQTVDGIAVTAGQRVLVKDQTTTTQNGIYLCAAGAWTRVAASQALEAGQYVYVTDGTVNKSRFYWNNPTNVAVWSLSGEMHEYTFSGGLVLTGLGVAIGTSGSNGISNSMVNTNAAIAWSKFETKILPAHGEINDNWAHPTQGSRTAFTLDMHLTYIGSMFKLLRGDTANINYTPPITLANAKLKNRTYAGNNAARAALTNLETGDVFLDTELGS